MRRLHVPLDQRSRQAIRTATLTLVSVSAWSCGILDPCARSQVEFVSVGGPDSSFPAVMWVGDFFRLTGVAGIDPASEFCQEKETMYTVTDNPEAFQFTSSDPSVVTVASNAMVTAMGVGTATITAASHGIQSRSGYPVQVEPPIKRVEYTAVPAIAHVGDTVSVTMQAVGNDLQPIQNAALTPMTWRGPGVTNGPWVPGSRSKYAGQLVVTAAGNVFIETRVLRTGYPSFTSALQLEVRP